MFIAKLFGIMYIVVGVGILLNKSHYHTMMSNFLKDSALMYFGGVMSLAAGATIVMFHNDWASNWTLLITLIGWLALIKGIVIVVSPKSMTDLAHFWLKRIQLAGLMTVCLGLLFSYYGFIA